MRNFHDNFFHCNFFLVGLFSLLKSSHNYNGILSSLISGNKVVLLQCTVFVVYFLLAQTNSIKKTILVRSFSCWWSSPTFCSASITARMPRPSLPLSDYSHHPSAPPRRPPGWGRLWRLALHPEPTTNRENVAQDGEELRQLLLQMPCMPWLTHSSSLVQQFGHPPGQLLWELQILVKSGRNHLI